MSIRKRICRFDDNGVIMTAVLVKQVILVVAILCGGVFAEGGLPSLHQVATNGDIAAVNRLIDDGAGVANAFSPAFQPQTHTTKKQ